MIPGVERVQNPSLLPLLLLALVPIVLHVLDRRRARTVDWPAMRFLLLGSKARLRRWRFREALLILVRSLLILAAVTAILGPIESRTVSVEDDPGEGRSVVLAIDASWSMTQRGEDDSSSALDAAKTDATRVLDSLRPDDRVALVLEGAAGTPVEGSSPAREAISSLAPMPGAFRLATALDRAADILGRHPDLGREVWVFTDLQRTQLDGGDPARWVRLRERLRSARDPARIRIIDCGPSRPRNRFVVSLDPPSLAVGTDEDAAFRVVTETSGPPGDGAPAAGESPPDGGRAVGEMEPRTGSARPAGEPRDEPGAREAPRAAPLRLLDGGVEIGSAQAPPVGDAPASVEIVHRFRQAGIARVAAALPEDALPADDRAYAAVEVLDRLDVLVVGTTSGRDGARGIGSPRAADYVDLGLSPRAPGAAEAATIHRVRVEPALPAGDLARWRVIVIAGVPRLDAETGSRLRSFAEAGGGLLVFAGSEIETSSWVEHGHAGGSGFLPLSPRSDLGSSTGAAHPRKIEVSHPALSVFSGGDEGDLARIAIRRWTRFLGAPQGVSTLAEVEPGSPWILEARLGAGKVVVVATGAEPGDSDLPLTTLWVPLLHRLTRWLAAEDPASRNVVLGEPISLDLPTEAVGAEAWVLPPSGVRLPARVELRDGRLVARHAATDAPGFWEIRVEAPAMSRVFAARIPAAESRIERIPPEELGRLLEDLGAELEVDAGETLRGGVVRRVEGETWPAFLGAALILAIADLLLGRGFSRSAPSRRLETR